MNKIEYKVEQNGLKFHLITELINNQIQLYLIETNTLNLCIYKGIFSLNDLKQKSPEFYYMSSIEEAYNYISQIIENQQISIDYSEESVEIYLLANNNQLHFNLNVSNAENKPNYNPIITNNIHQTQTQNIETIYPPPSVNYNQNNYQLNDLKTKIQEEKNKNNNLSVENGQLKKKIEGLNLKIMNYEKQIKSYIDNNANNIKS